MGRPVFVGIILCCALYLPAQQALFPYDVVQSHEIAPHRLNVPVAGAAGFNQLKLKLTVSPAGKVLAAEASGDTQTLKLWPQIKGEVEQWRFTPFESKGVAVTAHLEEYVNLVPPEGFPAIHVEPPPIRADSNIVITLTRSVCFGACPAYTVIARTGGIEFDGIAFVAAPGKHTATVDPLEVRELAAKFITADFYSMDATYSAPITDMPGCSLSISIDGKTKIVNDYVGEWVGMPQIITQLEKDVDELTGTERWIKGPDKSTPH